MNSKDQSKDRDDNERPSSISKSPYNLRRNQTQPGAITKRNSSVKLRKDISIVTLQTSKQSLSTLSLQDVSIRNLSTSISLDTSNHNATVSTLIGAANICDTSSPTSRNT